MLISISISAFSLDGIASQNPEEKEASTSWVSWQIWPFAGMSNTSQSSQEVQKLNLQRSEGEEEKKIPTGEQDLFKSFVMVPNHDLSTEEGQQRERSPDKLDVGIPEKGADEEEGSRDNRLPIDPLLSISSIGSIGEEGEGGSSKSREEEDSIGSNSDEKNTEEERLPSEASRDAGVVCG